MRREGSLNPSVPKTIADMGTVHSPTKLALENIAQLRRLLRDLSPETLKKARTS